MSDDRYVVELFGGGKTCYAGCSHCPLTGDLSSKVSLTDRVLESFDLFQERTKVEGETIAVHVPGHVERLNVSTLPRLPDHSRGVTLSVGGFDQVYGDGDIEAISNAIYVALARMAPGVKEPYSMKRARFSFRDNQGVFFKHPERVRPILERFIERHLSKGRILVAQGYDFSFNFTINGNDIQPEDFDRIWAVGEGDLVQGREDDSKTNQVNGFLFEEYLWPLAEHVGFSRGKLKEISGEPNGNYESGGVSSQAVLAIDKEGHPLQFLGSSFRYARGEGGSGGTFPSSFRRNIRLAPNHVHLGHYTRFINTKLGRISHERFRDIVKGAEDLEAALQGAYLSTIS